MIAAFIFGTALVILLAWLFGPTISEHTRTGSAVRTFFNVLAAAWVGFLFTVFPVLVLAALY